LIEAQIRKGISACKYRASSASRCFSTIRIGCTVYSICILPHTMKSCVIVPRKAFMIRGQVYRLGCRGEDLNRYQVGDSLMHTDTVIKESFDQVVFEQVVAQQFLFCTPRNRIVCASVRPYFTNRSFLCWQHQSLIKQSLLPSSKDPTSTSYLQYQIKLQTCVSAIQPWLLFWQWVFLPNGPIASY
jgi:hypothetical protein